MKKIFVIDQSQFVCSLMEKSLRSSGCEVYTLTSSQDAFHVIRDFMPDILVLDINIFKNSDGLLLGQEIFNSKEFPQMSLLVLTTKKEWDELHNIYSFLHYAKPFFRPFSPLHLDSQLQQASSGPTN